MSVMTIEQRIALVDDAIDDLVVSGVSIVTVLGQTFTKASLGELRVLRSELVSRRDAGNDSGARRLDVQIGGMS